MRQTPKTYEQALAEIIRVLSALEPEADFVEGSKYLSLAQAIAFQAADLSERQEASVTAAIPEAVYAAFGFARRVAANATGSLSFQAPGLSPVPVFIPAGTEASTPDGLTYVTLDDATLNVGEASVTVPAAAAAPGAGSNVTSARVTRLGSGIPGVQGVTNPVPFAGGTPGESDDDQQARFSRWLDTLDGSSIAGLTQAALNVTLPGEGAVGEVLIVDGSTDAGILPGRFRVYLYRQGGVSAALTAAIGAIIDLRRAAGCIPTVTAVPGTPVAMGVSLRVRQLGTVIYARAAINAYFSLLKFGEKVSRENLITALTTAHPDILEVTLNTPTDDVFCTAYAHLEPGAVVITEGV